MPPHRRRSQADQQSVNEERLRETGCLSQETFRQTSRADVSTTPAGTVPESDGAGLRAGPRPVDMNGRTSRRIRTGVARWSGG